jgi:hypothetical protein
MTTTTTKPLSMRSRLALRWSTEPRNVGYPRPGQEPDIDTKAVDFRGTPRQVVAEIDSVRRRIGPSVFVAFHVSCRGEQVDLFEVTDLVAYADMHAEFRRHV